MNLIETKLGVIDINSMGEWDDLQAAGRGLAMVYDAVADLIDKRYCDDDTLDAIKKHIWGGIVGSDKRLETMTPLLAIAIAARGVTAIRGAPSSV